MDLEMKNMKILIKILNLMGRILTSSETMLPMLIDRSCACTFCLDDCMLH